MQLNKLQLDNMNLKVHECTCGKANNSKLPHSEYNNFNQLQLTNKSSRSLSKSPCDPGRNSRSFLGTVVFPEQVCLEPILEARRLSEEDRRWRVGV